MQLAIELNPNHDLEKLGGIFRSEGRLQVRNLFADAAAEDILATLKQTRWGLAFNEGEKVTQLDADALSRLTPQDAATFVEKVKVGARVRFQFLYAYYPLFAAYFDPATPGHPLFSVYEFINSAPFLDFIRAVTGMREIKWADAQATMFQAGHFLQLHGDHTAGGERAAAYVLNFTKDWGSDWGGYLQFFDDKMDIEHAYRPIFNGLNIFKIPRPHSVSVVAPYVQAARYSITGWLRTDDPPEVIGG